MRLLERWSRIHPADRLIGLTLLLALLAGLAAVPDMGADWDGENHWNYGHAVWSWWHSFDMNGPAIRDLDGAHMPYYGALFGVIATAAERIHLGSDHLRLYHTLALLFGLLGLVFAARIARDLAGPWAGLTAAVLLALTPRYAGDSLMNPVDIPFAGTFCVSVFYLHRLAHELGATGPPSWRSWAKFGAGTGLALGVRIGGVLPLAWAALLIGLWALGADSREGGAGTLKWDLPRLAAGWAGSVVTAYLLAGLFWPRLLTSPLTHTLDTVRMSSKFPWAANRNFYGGRYIVAADIPWDYLPTWVLITMPPQMMAGLGSALFLGARLWRRYAPDSSGRLSLVALGLATFFAPLYAIWEHSTLYDGFRHFLFELPMLAVVAALGFRELFQIVPFSWRKVAVVLPALLSLEPAWWLVRSHPYQYTYFSPLLGGIRRESAYYETDYWGLSLRAAGRWITDHRSELGEGTLYIQTNASWHLLEPFLPHDVERATRQSDPARLFLAFYRFPPLPAPAGPQRFYEIARSQLGPPVFQLGVSPDQAVPFFEIFRIGR